MKCKLIFTGYIFYVLKIAIGGVILIIAAMLTTTDILREKLLRLTTHESAG
ncbi:MAG: hypothetical protein V4635_04325 [Bacteroidota bacterium]